MNNFTIKFRPEFGYFLNVKFCESREELAAVAKDLGYDGLDSDTQAFCVYNYDSTGDDLGWLVFCGEKQGVIVHECVHAGISFLSHKSFTTEGFGKLDEQSQYNYYQEALALTVESLFDQVMEKTADSHF